MKIGILGLLLGIFALDAKAGPSPEIYVEGLGAGWASWSWGVSFGNSTAVAFKGSYSGAVIYNSAWAGFSPGAGSYFDTTGYKHLTIAVYNSQNGDDLWLFAASPSNPNGGYLHLTDYSASGSIPQGQWTWIRIPTQDLGLGSNPTIYYFAIQSAKGNAAVYFDEVRFEANVTLYEGVQAQRGPGTQLFYWGGSVSQPSSGGDYWLQVNVANPWGGIQLQEKKGGVSSSDYGMLTVLFQRTLTYQNLHAYLVDQNNVVRGSVNLANYVVGGSPTVNQWYRALIPIRDFGVGSGVALGGVVVDSDVAGTFYVDDVRFVEGLKFPLTYQGWTPWTAEIQSVMDHRNDNVGLTHKLGCYDGTVTAYTGEAGTGTPFGGMQPYAGCNDSRLLYGYKNSDGSIFAINGHYRQSDSDTAKRILYYDGHPGYDYPLGVAVNPANCAGSQAVYATASGKLGKVCTQNNTSASCTSDNLTIAETYLNHGYGLQSLYTHMCMSTVVEGQYVRKGDQIGWSGQRGANSHHLHYSALWGVSSPRYIDPYGWKPFSWAPVQVDPYTGAKNVCLWENGCP